jgi:hypothetical protein
MCTGRRGDKSEIKNLLDRLTQMSVGHPTSGRDFFSTHFDINYLPENQARTEALWEASENGGRAAYDGGRRVTLWHGFAGQG